MHACSAIGDPKLHPFLGHTLLSVSGNDYQEPLIAVIIIRGAKVLRAVTKEDELFSRVSFGIKLLQQEFRPVQRLIATHRAEECLSQEELGNLHILARLFEVLLIGHHKAKLMVGQLGDGR